MLDMLGAFRTVGHSGLKCVFLEHRTQLDRSIHRANPFLAGMPHESTASLVIKPSASYAVDIKATVKNRSSWIEIGGPSVQCSDAQNCHVRCNSTSNGRLQLHFNTSGFGFEDGKKLDEVLVLNGMAQGLSVYSDPVSISLQVASSPSFDLSTISIPTTVRTGEAAGISIKAVDTEGLPITEARGRFMRLELEKDGAVSHFKHDTTFRHAKGDFYVDIPSTELTRPGIYKIWISEVFGYNVTKSSTKPQGLPTEAHPRTFVVVKEETKDTVKIVSGIFSGLLFTSLICGVIYWARKNPARAKKMASSFMLVMCRGLMMFVKD